MCCVDNWATMRCDIYFTVVFGIPEIHETVAELLAFLKQTGYVRDHCLIWLYNSYVLITVSIGLQVKLHCTYKCKQKHIHPCSTLLLLFFT